MRSSIRRDICSIWLSTTARACAASSGARRFLLHPVEPHAQGTEGISQLVRYDAELFVHAPFGGGQCFRSLLPRARSLCTVLHVARNAGNSDVADVLQQGRVDRQAIGPAALLVDDAH